MSNGFRQLRSYLLSSGALGCFRLAPGWPLDTYVAISSIRTARHGGGKDSVVRANALPKKPWILDVSEEPQHNRFLRRQYSPPS
ncbi:MAG: hypothetical protein N2C12_08110 [Planctomycetales bacterium]